MTRRLPFLLLTVATLFTQGCAQRHPDGPDLATALAVNPAGQTVAAPEVPVIRVRLLENQPSITLTATASPTAKTALPDGAPIHLNLTPSSSYALTLTPAGWLLGGINLGPASTDLLLFPARDGSVAVNNRPYRGGYRFVPTTPGRFDVVNDVDAESYVKSVVPREMYPKWHPEAYKAQAIVARTYAIYESRAAALPPSSSTTTPAAPRARYFDVDDDTRSQVYGGLKDETPAATAAVDATRGIVVAYGPQGHETIFKTYFSSCCGGKAASSADAFGDPPSPPLAAHETPNACANFAPKYSWGPVTLSKTEITRRLHLYGQKKNHPVEASIGPVARIDVAALNPVGRPARFQITDTKGTRYSIGAEDLRHAMNVTGNGTTLYSSYFTPVNNPTTIAFTNAHGFGHGVGLCQWCTQALALQGRHHEDLVLLSYPGAKLVRAY